MNERLERRLAYMLIPIVGLLLLLSLTPAYCTEGAGMVAPPGKWGGGHICRCTGLQLTLKDQRPADGPVQYLCLGYPWTIEPPSERPDTFYGQ